MSKEYVPLASGPVPAMGEQNMSINRQREIKAQALLRAQMESAKVPAPMNHENYGFGKIKY